MKSALVERVVQSMTVESGIDCTSLNSCKRSCPKNGGFGTCGSGTNVSMFYCCADAQHCSGTFKCPSNGGLQQCACSTPNAPGSLMLEETVSVYPTSPAPVVHTTTEFSMVNKGRELVTRHMTDIDNTVNNRPTFETDSNGMLMMKRTFNKTMWGKNESACSVSMPVAGNYYPLASPGAIRITDPGNGKSFAVVTDRGHGASSLQKGWVEVMMGRRVAEGGGISVDDTDHITARNYLALGASRSATAQAHRELARQVAAPLVPVILPASAPRAAGTGASPALAATALPSNVHLLSLDRAGVETTAGSGASRVLLRIHHMYQNGEADASLTGPAAVDLTTMLPPPLKLSELVELPLNGVGAPAAVPSPEAVTLAALQTRTFEATITRG